MFALYSWTKDSSPGERKKPSLENVEANNHGGRRRRLVSRTAKHSPPPSSSERERRKRPNVESCSSRAYIQYNVGRGDGKKHIALQTRLAIHEWAPTAKCQTCLPLLCVSFDTKHDAPQICPKLFPAKKKHPGMNLLSSVCALQNATMYRTIWRDGVEGDSQDVNNTLPQLPAVCCRRALSLLLLLGLAQGPPNQRSQVTFFNLPVHIL